jgi:hypothetical protein
MQCALSAEYNYMKMIYPDKYVGHPTRLCDGAVFTAARVIAQNALKEKGRCV